MAHTTTTVTLPSTPSRGSKFHCYCRAAERTLLGRNVVMASISESISPNTPTRISCLTQVRHNPRSKPDGNCWFVFDGAWKIPARSSTGEPLTVEATNAPADAEAEAKAPLPEWTGTVTFEDAAEVIRRAWDAYSTMAAMVPVRASAQSAVRRAFTSHVPQLPESIRSYYCRGRVRRVPATGRWAADLGICGSTRPLGEYDSIDEARDAVRAAHEKAWCDLEAWLREYVPGAWDLERLPLSIDVEDRMSIQDCAAFHGVRPGTWTSYVARGQAPAPDSPAGTRSPWWHRATVTGWERPGTGARTDLAAPAGQDPVDMVTVLLEVAVWTGVIEAWDTGETVQQAAARIVVQSRARLTERGHQDPAPARIWAEILAWFRWEQHSPDEYRAAHEANRHDIKAALAAKGIAQV